MTMLETRSEYPAGKRGEKKAKKNAYTHTSSSCKNALLHWLRPILPASKLGRTVV